MEETVSNYEAKTVSHSNTKLATTPPTQNSEGLPAGWRLVKLGDVCEIINGKNQKGVINSNGKYPIYGSSGIFGYADKYLCNEGTTIVGRKGNINSPIYVTTKFWNVDTAFGLAPKADIDGKFLFYFCKGFNFHALDKSTTIPSLAKTDLLKIDISIPSLQAQHAIVSKIEELFSELDKGKQQLETAQQQLKIYRQAVLKWGFEGKLTNENVKEGELPKGWRIFKLGDITINFDGKRIPLSRDVRATRKGEYRYYGATEVVDHIDDYIFDGVYLLIGEDGANLLTKSRQLAFIAEGKFWVNNDAHVLQAKENLVLKYLLNYFNSINLGQYVTGSAQPKLTQANLNKIPVPIPTIEEQQLIVQEIETRLSVCDKVEETITTSLAQAETLRQSILKKAFEGKLV